MTGGTIPSMRSVMNRSRLALGSIVCGLLALVGSACAPNEVSFYIRQAQVPQATGMGGMCTVTGDPSALMSQEGTMDLAFTTSYFISPLYVNQLVGYADPMALRAETRGIFVEGADIYLYNTTPPDPYAHEGAMNLLASTTVYTSTFVPAGSSQGLGYAVGGLEIISPSIPGLAASLRASCVLQPVDSRPECPPRIVRGASMRIVAVIRPFGHTQGGIRLQGAEFRYSINTCCGCLLRFPAAADSSMHPGPDCNEGAPDPSCSFGQDRSLDCRLCSQSDPLCQPPGYTPAGSTMPCAR